MSVLGAGADEAGSAALATDGVGRWPLHGDTTLASRGERWVGQAGAEGSLPTCRVQTPKSQFKEREGQSRPTFPPTFNKDSA